MTTDQDTLDAATSADVSATPPSTTGTVAPAGMHSRLMEAAKALGPRMQPIDYEPPAPLCFLDTETTALHPGRRPWEIALIRRDYQTDVTYTEETMLIQVRGVDLSTADPKSLQISGFYERHHEYRTKADHFSPGGVIKEQMAEVLKTPTSRKLTELAAAQNVERMTRGTHLVAAVPSFDAMTLDRMLHRHRLTAAWHYHLIDVEAMAAGYLAALGGGSLVHAPWNSEDLSTRCGITPPTAEERHTALGDAQWVRRWYDQVSGINDLREAMGA